MNFSAQEISCISGCHLPRALRHLQSCRGSVDLRVGPVPGGSPGPSAKPHTLYAQSAALLASCGEVDIV
jgi:hypothetical protein